MDAVDLRYSRDAKLRDVLICLALALVVGTVLAPLISPFLPRGTPLPAYLLAVYVSCWIPGIAVAGAWRWGRRGRVDADGAALDGVSVAWSEVGEIFALHGGGFELRAGDNRLRLTSEFEGIDRVGPIAEARRGSALAVELRRAFDGGATLRFRGPMEPREALFSGGLLSFLLFPAIFLPLGFAAFRLPAGQMLKLSVTCILAALWVVGMLSLALGGRARACGWIEAGPDGLRGRPAWRPRSCRWEEIASVERGKRGGLTLRLKSGGAIVVPSDWSNLGALEAIARTRC